MHPITFAMEALADFRTIGAVAPSSRFLTRTMVDRLPLRRAKVVVEFGCGTGTITRELLSEMPRDAVLLAFEINPRFSRYLREKIRDPRLEVLPTSAENIREEVQRRGFQHVDAVASSLALSLMPDQLKHDILSESVGLLHPSGTFAQYLYLHGIHWEGGKPGLFGGAQVLRKYFRHVEKTIVWPNLPPAFVYTCRGAKQLN
jgi:phospholipid N-methyltransferase